MVVLLYYVLLVTIVICDGTQHKRFLVDESQNITDVLIKLSAEVATLKQTQARLTNDVTNLTETLTYVNSQLQEARSQLSHVNSQSLSNAGSVYVRWGSSSCSGTDTELVYSGYAGGSNWMSKGAAANYLCLVPDPALVGNNTGVDGARVFGAEYIFDNVHWTRASFDLIGLDVTFHDVPCAVCRSPRSSNVMVPGKATCKHGWHEEYSGYLMGGYYGHNASSEFVCLDRGIEVIPGTRTKQLGKLFYSVRAQCGPLPCPPYEDGKDLTCAVCSK